MYGFAYVKPDGSVVSYSSFSNIGGKGAPGDTSSFRNIRSIVCTKDGIVGLRYDGSCIATKPGFTYAYISECNHWYDIIAIAAGDHQVVGLRHDGTCVANSIKQNAGYGYDGQSDVSGWKNIVQIACGNNFSLGLQSDGQVVLAGKSYGFGTESIACWSNIKMIAAGRDAAVALTKEGKVIGTGKVSIVGIKPEKGILQLSIFEGNTYALYADGSVGCSEGKRSLSINEKNIISLVSNYSTFCALDENGKIYVYSQPQGVFCNRIPTDIRIFDSYEQVVTEYKQVMEEIRIIEIKEDRRKHGLCQFCGGKFKGFFIPKCSECGKQKDYY